MANLSERQLRWLLAGAGVGCFALLMALEILPDVDELTPIEVMGDAASLFLTVGAAVGVTLLLARIRSQHDEQMALIRDLEVARAEGNGWRTKAHAHLAGLKTEMDRQFQSWGLTDAEREVGLLILKGLSHKEIATLRATSDATVRQQAQSIYRKAELPGKTAFSAYFLEDLMTSDVAPARLNGAGGNGHDREPAPVDGASDRIGPGNRHAG